MKFLVTGAAGFVGKRLQEYLTRAGHQVATTSRSGNATHHWDPMSGKLPASAFEGVQAVIHLAGENIGQGRWDDAKMKLIRDSRVLGTRNLLASIKESPQKPRTFFCASAVGYYGDRGEEKLTEDSAPGNDFLAEVCKAWEEEACKAREMGMKWISGRFGIILGPEGGALPAMLPPYKWGLGGPIGGGKQWMSWIHVEDVCGLILHSVERSSIEGPINVTAPVPVINKDFAHTMGTLLKSMTIFGTPYFLLRLAVGKFAEYLVMSQRVTPVKAMATRYVYKYRELMPALRDCLKKYIKD
jgi:hypothetical protein